jgi:hypothetical protein
MIDNVFLDGIEGDTVVCFACMFFASAASGEGKEEDGERE